MADSKHAERRGVETDQRRTNGRAKILDVAAKLFYERGYAQASIRAIAAATGIESASLYYHFPSKDEILFAVEQEAFHRLEQRVVKDLRRGKSDPWDRLTSASVTHVRAVLENREYISVTTRELPQDQKPELQSRLLAPRERYEDIFRGIVLKLPLNPGTDRTILRLALIGALASTLVWYREGGNTPRDIALQIVAMFRRGCDPAFAKTLESSAKSRASAQSA